MKILKCGLAALALSALPTNAISQEDLFKLMPERLLDAGKGGGIAAQAIQLNRALLREGESFEVVIQLPDEKLAVELAPLSPKSAGLAKGQAGWYAQFQDKTGGDIFVYSEKGITRAVINRGARAYEIRTLEGGQHILEAKEVKDAFPLDHPPETEGLAPKAPDLRGEFPLPQQDCADPVDEIDVMVLYTPAARTGAGGVAQMEAEINFAMARANLANANSNVFHRLNLVHVAEVAYTEPSAGVDMNVLLPQLQSTSDMALDSIHGLRDAHKADVVSMIVENAGGCGLGYFLENPNSGHAAWPFNLVTRSCAGGNLSFAHEVGHNMGADHDRANTSAHAWNFNYGHIQPVPATGGPWRTVMSYNGPCNTMTAGMAGCTRLPVFSNPGVTIQGSPAGAALSSASPAHNVHAFAQTDNIVSQFRCRTPGAAALAWMKDTWADTGLEPDPATAAQAMWESPYIWVRNNADATLEHQHEHQNPELGQTNYVYVKIHNDGAASASGALELYWASASTNLNSPANWNLVQSQTIASLSPGTNIVQFPWSSLPGTGHYCMLARWNDSGAPLSFADLNSYVRGNRRHVWRNMNIVDLTPDEAEDQQFIVRGLPNGQSTFLVLTSAAAGAGKAPWEKVARLRLKLLDGEKLESKWAGKGVESIDEKTLEANLADKPAVIGPLNLKEGQELTVGIETLFDAGLVKELTAGLDNDALNMVRVIQTNEDGASAAFESPASLLAKSDLAAGGNTYVLTIPANSKRARARK